MEAITRQAISPEKPDRHRARSRASEFYDKASGKYVFQEVRQSERSSGENGELLGEVGGAVSNCFPSKMGWPKTIGRMEA